MTTPVIIPRAVSARVRDAVLARRLTLIVAPAGTGKTTVLAQVGDALASEADVIALRFDPGHNSPPAFRDVLGTATRAVVGAPAWEPGDPVRPDDMTQYLAALAGRPNPERPVCLLLDDLHQLHDLQVLEALETAIAAFPDDVHMAIASRTRTPFLLAQWRSRGELAEFGAGHLAVSLAEARILAGPETSEADLGAVLDATGGWMSLVLHSLHHDAPRRVVAEHLEEEVFAALTPQQWTVLETTSALEEITVPAAIDLSGIADAARVLDDLEQRGLVERLDADDPTWWIAPVARQWLASRLDARDPAEAERVQRMARGWHPTVVDLSSREREVLELLDSELAVQEIASQLHVSYHTVKTHIRSIYAKLGVSSRVAAVRAARR